MAGEGALVVGSVLGLRAGPVVEGSVLIAAVDAGIR